MREKKRVTRCSPFTILRSEARERKRERERESGVLRKIKY